jgi:hypothetical protein
VVVGKKAVAVYAAAAFCREAFAQLLHFQIEEARAKDSHGGTQRSRRKAAGILDLINRIGRGQGRLAFEIIVALQTSFFDRKK